MTLLQLFFFAHIRPLETYFQNRMEVFNEYVLLMCLLVVQTFSDFVPSPYQRHYNGFAFIGLVCLYALVHLIFIIRDSIKQLITLAKKLKRKCCKKGPGRKTV